MSEERDFSISRCRIHCEKIQRPTRLLLLGDLHSEEHGPDNRDLLEAVRECAPDLILCTGDMIIGHRRCPTDTAERFLCSLTGIAPVWAVNGNHETRMRKDAEKYRSYVEKIREGGIHLLNRGARRLEINGSALSVAAIELPPSKYKKFRIPRLSEEETKRMIGAEPDRGAFQILLAHNPQFVRRYVEWGADLTVCGHFHGGLMRLPGGRSLVSPYGFPLPKYGWGHFQIRDSHVVVTAGLGDHTVPFRIHNPMEINVIDLD